MTHCGLRMTRCGLRMTRCGLRITVGLIMTCEGSICPVTVHGEGNERKIQGGDGHEGDGVVDHL
jgi:hypothetical protein